MKRLFVVALSIILLGLSCHGQRKEILIPDIPGYCTLKCDLHMHTVFSDGNVWPDIRVAEAFMEGLDAIAITDHLEYRPHKKDLIADHNRSYELAKTAAKNTGIILIKGTEITRSLPYGHYNALFIEDANPLDTPDFFEAVETAINQGAFVVWNHPGWSQKDGKSIWYEVQERLHHNGWMHGMEIVNGGKYYPLGHEWCIEKGISMLGTSDVHGLIAADYLNKEGSHRSLTLVFAKEKTQEGIKEALFAGRTLVYQEHRLTGDPVLLEAVLKAGLEIRVLGEMKATRSLRLLIKNTTDIDLNLLFEAFPDGFSGPETLTIPARRSQLLSFSKDEPPVDWTKVTIPFEVTNFMEAPAVGLKSSFDLANQH